MNSSRRTIILISIAIIGAGLISALHSHSFNAITGNRCNDVEDIVVEGKILSKSKTETIMSKMNSDRYSRYFGDGGTTATLEYEFFDNEGNHLFDVVDMGNRDIIKVIVNEKSRYYRLRQGEI